MPNPRAIHHSKQASASGKTAYQEMIKLGFVARRVP